MAYANTLPDLIIRLCRSFNTCALALTLLVCLDVFVLPESSHFEKVVDRELYSVEGISRYGGGTYKTYVDNAVLITENYRYPYTWRAQNYDPNKEDSIRLVTTCLFGIVKTGYMKPDGVEKELKQTAGMFGTLMFIPIAFGLIAAFGVAMRHNKEQLVNAVVMNLLLILVQLFVDGYILYFMDMLA
ncbi:hypothetical protein [Pontibacter akesuensis]|uniref:Uncharacterized protein n=1 Tax=Pontibacter akesuensis TaxID=388950 RepID=A0A1I7IEW7_9BACT|nr:hypothetical protein [Pontibacter akesuensis]GHA66831.1 hypothetical protein GCM10007389_19890 [Pontibacter akesuensis]SFU71406.1 hypothetical protein SAMN04487941_2157 [Pontibacter akesuensis]